MITNDTDAVRFLRFANSIIPRVPDEVIYPTGADWRLNIITAHDAQPALCKRSAGYRTVPGRFYTDETNFHVQ